MKKVKFISRSLFIVLMTGLLYQCDYLNTIYIKNNLDYDILIYSKSDITWRQFLSGNYNTDDGYWESLSYDGALNRIIVESGQKIGFLDVQSGQFLTKEGINYVLTEEFKDGIFDFYIKNIDSKEVIITKDNILTNPLVNIEEVDAGEWLITLDENE